MAVTYNLKGTTNSSFQIGKKGVVLTPADNTSATTVTFPNATGTLVLQDSTDTLTNKTISLTNNTLTGTTAEFNSALSDGSFATLAGTETLTNKTISLTNNTLTGTTAEFNSALSDGSFATLAGTETLTNKTLGATTIAGHLIPDTNITYDLGTSSLRFRDIYLSGTTIDLGGAKLTNDGSDNLDIKDSSGNRKIIRASAIELVDSSGKKMKLERDATTGKLKKTRKNADDSDEGSTDLIDIVGDSSPQLGGTLDANGNDIDMGTNTITDTKVGQWDTAYGWGDHSTQSYLSGTIGFPTDLGAVTGSTTSYLGIGPDLGSIASGDTFVGLAKDFGSIGETVTTTSAQTLSNKSFSGNIAFDTNTLFVDADNNRVGIGTVSPTEELDVTGDGAFSGNVTVTGNLTVNGTTTTVDSTTINVQNAFVFEGATADDFETTLTIVDPTADRTITLPNATGTVALTNSFTHFHSSAQTVTSGEATTNASSTVDYTFSELSGAIHYVAFLNRTLMRASEYSVSGTTLTVNSGVLATDDQIEVTGISV